jgi:hypothetical protein
MTLLETFVDLVMRWRPIFPQQRSWKLATHHALGAMLCLGRRCLTRIIWANGEQHRHPAKHYYLYSRSQWNPQQLFAPLWQEALQYGSDRIVAVAIDDTRLHKTGRMIPQAFHQRDPLSPPFHVNLMYGLRFLQASLLLPLYRKTKVGPRGIPIYFQEASVVKRPRKKASAEAWAQYRLAKKQHNLSQQFVEAVVQLRHQLDVIGGRHKLLLIVTDGSFCNRTVFSAIPPRVQIVARSRKDAKLCFRAPATSRCFYASEKFTPEQIRQENQIPWQTVKLFYGGKRRKIRFKSLPVYWQGGARRRPLRLFVLAPTPYRKRKSARLYYRDPAYLLSSDLTTSASRMIQSYLDRWQIEVNHREEKDTLGVGQAQLWNKEAVPKQPVLVVAAYSALMLAALKTFGAERDSQYLPLPKWRRQAKRASCLDLISLLRQEAVNHPEILKKIDLQHSSSGLLLSAAA